MDDEEEREKDGKEASDSKSLECRLCHKNVSKVRCFSKYSSLLAIIAAASYGIVRRYMLGLLGTVCSARYMTNSTSYIVTYIRKVSA